MEKKETLSKRQLERQKNYHHNYNNYPKKPQIISDKNIIQIIQTESSWLFYRDAPAFLV